MKYTILSSKNLKKLQPGMVLRENGIIAERRANGDIRWQVNIMVEGKRVSRTVGYESDGTGISDCEALVAKLTMDARHGRLGIEKVQLVARPFSKVADDYISRLSEEDGKDIAKKIQRLDLHLKPYFGARPLDAIKANDIERYKATRKSNGAKPATINRELAILSHIFSKALEWEWIDKKPIIRRNREDNARMTYLTAEQAGHFLDVAKKDRNPQVYLFASIALETSMRRMEILSIRLSDIDLDRKVIYIPKAKAGRREQPISATVIDAVKPYVEAGESEWLFPSRGTRKSDSGHTNWLETAYRRVVVAAGFDPSEVLRHTLRHTAITHMVQSGIDLPTVMRLSGHKTLAMVARYSHQNGEHIQEALGKLSDRYRQR